MKEAFQIPSAIHTPERQTRCKRSQGTKCPCPSDASTQEKALQRRYSSTCDAPWAEK